MLLNANVVGAAILIKQKDCLSPVITTGSQQSFLRGLTLELPPTCSNLSQLFPNPGSLPTCDSTTSTSQGNVCGPNAECTDRVILGSVNWTNAHCSCPNGSYVEGALSEIDSLVAPYNQSRGCVLPVRATRIQRHFTSNNIVTSLSKNFSHANDLTVNVTLELSGTDWAEGSLYTWAVEEADPVPWIHVSTISGVVTAPMYSPGTTTDLTVLLRGSGARDGTSTASIRVLYSPHASALGQVTPRQMLTVPVVLFVGAVSVAKQSSFVQRFVHAVFDRPSSYSFVARDCNDIPLSHAEVETFSAFFIHASTMRMVNTSIEYTFNGTYSITATLALLGIWNVAVVHMENGMPEEVHPRLRIEVGCLPDQQPTADGNCGCAIGLEPPLGSGCRKCTIGKHKTSVGNTTCVSCPAHSTTAAEGEGSITRCLCLPNYFNRLSTGVECEVCMLGTGASTL